jgi:hypothetical protein
VAYKPDQFFANGEFRPVKITMSEKKFRIRAKKGYYVPKQ